MKSLLLASVAFSSVAISDAFATTVDTFSFQQLGYSQISGALPIPIMTGSFTGSVESSGIIGLTDLINFHLNDGTGIF